MHLVHEHITRAAIFLLLAATLFPAGIASAQSNIDPANKWSWAENAGWANWYDNGVTSGAFVGTWVLSGFVWAENLGWLYLGSGAPLFGNYYSNAVPGDTGVNIAPNGDLFGYAWGENIGWVNFATAGIAGPLGAWIEVCCAPPGPPAGGRLHGFVWGENIGWINLEPGSVPPMFIGLAPGVSRAKGDLNGDVLRDGLDIADFVATVISPGTATPAEFCAADMDGDRAVTLADVPLFVTCLLTGACVCP
jgi:hypothetical protein